MDINGIMIDCARVLERPAYYFRLVEFMADWGMNTLVLHFTDDHGCAVVLPGFEELAMPQAFSADDIRRLVAHAAGRGIEIIPELETFGHIRYLTAVPRYRRLGLHCGTRKLTFNALDPLNAESAAVMDRLIGAVAHLFPGPRLHLGCDEVNLAGLARRQDGLDEAAVWSEYVNTMIGLARRHGKSALIWADHLVKNADIARRVGKEVTAVHWHYEPEAAAEPVLRLQAAGYGRIVLAPSLACYRHRFLPAAGALANTRAMVGVAAATGAAGVINTIWCPFRYFQGALGYGIAFSGALVAARGELDLTTFHTRFARQTLGLDLAPELAAFLDAYPRFGLDYEIANKLYRNEFSMTPAEEQALRAVNDLGRTVLPAAAGIVPTRNLDLWDDMLLAARASWLCSECWALNTAVVSEPRRRAAFYRLRRELRTAAAASWDHGRFPDDPQKTRPQFPNEAPQFALRIINRLKLLNAIRKTNYTALG
ncbi:MAG: family 20 glycosylhydrolase [Lentisphaeria bacterium]